MLAWSGEIYGRPVEGTVQAGACFGPLDVVSLVEALVSNGVRVGYGPWSGVADLRDARMARATLMAVLDPETAEFDGMPVPVDPVPQLGEELLEAPYNIPNAFGRGLRFGLAGRFAGKFHPGRGGADVPGGRRGAVRGLVHRLRKGSTEPAAVKPNPAFPNAKPRTSDEAFERYALEQEAYELAMVAADPGPEAGAGEARVKAIEAEGRRRNRALNVALGADLAKFIDRKWGRDQGLRRQLLDGELTIEEAEELAYEEWQAMESRRLLREVDREADYGLEKKSLPCFSCGKFKARPSDVCGWCGDDPVPTASGSGSNRFASETAEFDRAYGYGSG